MKIFISHSGSDLELAQAIASWLRDAGHDVSTATEMSIGTEVLAEISSAIRSADVMVALVTRDNANIFYELGLATGANVPIVITATPDVRLPADLTSVPFVALTGDKLRDAQCILRRLKILEGHSPKKSVDFVTAEAELRAASRDPAFLASISPATFEELIAKLFEERGYEVTMTPRTSDSGVDLVVISPKEKKTIAVELKKGSSQSRVSVEPVRRLLDSVTNMGAPVGMLLTTSGFTTAAVAFAHSTPLVLRTLDQVLAAGSEEELLN